MAVEVATLVGTWNAARPDGSRFDLNLTPDAKFTWSFAQKDQAAQKFDGTYTMEGNVLALERTGVVHWSLRSRLRRAGSSTSRWWEPRRRPGTHIPEVVFCFQGAGDPASWFLCAVHYT